MASRQEFDYGEHRDYTYGSPHLAHAVIRKRVEAELGDLVQRSIAEHGRCRVLEVGAGHGGFTSTLRAHGAEVTVTEMSAPSADYLRRRFADDEMVHVIHDPEADAGPDLVARGCELIVFISVLHHIPDYVSAVRSLVEPMAPGGAFYCAQDPLWHPDRALFHLAASKASYLVWRLAQGNVRRGLATRVRRLRGVYDEANPSDMVEYHYVRQGVNESDMGRLLDEYFDRVAVRKYWSTQSPALQRLGDRVGLLSDFAVTASGRTSQ